MTFGAPWMLAGLVLALVPLWFHLRRRELKRIPFPAVAILADVVGRRRASRKAERIALLLIRMLAIAAVVLAAARPGLKVSRLGGLRTGLPLALVVVLDDSMSMRMKTQDGRTVFDRAAELARVEIGRLRPGDAAGLVLTGRPVRAPLGEVEFNRDWVGRLLAGTRVGDRSGDTTGALEVASRMLDDCPLPQREIVLISDLAKSGWSRGAVPWRKGAQIALRIVDAAPDAPRDNAAVDRIDVRPAPDSGPRDVTIEARVANHSPSPLRAAEVILEVDGEESARGSLDVPARSSATKRFHHRFETDGMHRGVVRIRPDRLAEDDARSFSAMIRRSITALVIDGDYRPGSYRDEAFYLVQALATPVPGEVPITPLVVDTETAATAPLAGNDVVFLAGVNDLKGDLAGRLSEYVKAGGGLFVSAGKATQNLTPLDPILPARVRSVREARGPKAAFRIAAVNRGHPVFQPFGDGATGLEGARVYSHLLVEPDPSADLSTLIELGGGVPLLMERKAGAGAVMFLCTTVDRDSTDLPIRPGFLPLVQRAARHLAGRLDDPQGPRRFAVGDTVPLEVTEGMRRLLVQGPDGQDRTFPANELLGRSRIPFAGTLTPGNYRVWAEIPGFGGLKELLGAEFAVETDPAESDLARLDSLPGQEARPVALAMAEGVLPTWPFLLLAVALLLLAETFLAGRGLRRSHVKNIR
ncbi:MAG: BatA domain-containing protein [Deltaproteobacteria bacterium]|nr:BatA domain-containing protein [Deltaproteobacteria bacterium]